jgi:hypothetical protein
VPVHGSSDACASRRIWSGCQCQMSGVGAVHIHPWSNKSRVACSCSSDMRRGGPRSSGIPATSTYTAKWSLIPPHSLISAMISRPTHLISLTHSHNTVDSHERPRAIRKCNSPSLRAARRVGPSSLIMSLPITPPPVVTGEQCCVSGSTCLRLLQ